MSGSSFVIDGPDADLSPIHLPTLVNDVRALARPVISNFHVGAVGLGSTGRIFFGVNLEFPGLPLHHSVHAEQFLVANLALHDEPQLDYIAVSSAPCGHCRQFLQEIRSAPDIKILITSGNGDEHQNRFSEFTPLAELLPLRFGPRVLLDESVPLLLEPRHNCLTLNLTLNQTDLVNHALEAANKSHAPYSNSPSGLALVDDQGRIYKGSYMESAAYNPSMGLVQAAIIAYVIGGGSEYERIVGAVLVEKADAKVKQEHTAKLLLQVVSPRCELVVVHCHGGV